MKKANTLGSKQAYGCLQNTKSIHLDLIYRIAGMTCISILQEGHNISPSLFCVKGQLSFPSAYRISFKKTLVCDNNNKEFYWIYLFILKAHIDFLKDFEPNTIFFAMNWKKIILIVKDSHGLEFFNWWKYCLAVLHVVCILQKYLFKICYCKICWK